MHHLDACLVSRRGPGNTPTEDVVIGNEALQNLADRFLEALITEVDPPFEPDESVEWAAAFLASVRRFREVRDFMHSKEAERAAETLGKRATADTYRFFWEFWQNADDAEATEIEFAIDTDRLVITTTAGHSTHGRSIA